MGAGGTILLLFALSKKAREHLIFSQPSDKSAMYIAIAFRTSLRHFSLLTELKAQFNHNGVISRFGSLLSMRHSSISLNHFMASFDTQLWYSSLTLMYASFFYNSGFFIMFNILLVTSIDTHWWSCLLRCLFNFFWIALVNKTPSQWSSTKNQSINSLYIVYSSVHWPLSKSNCLSKICMLASKTCTSSILVNFFNSSSSNTFSSWNSSSNCLMRLWRLLISPFNPCIVCSLEGWHLWNSLYCDCRSLYNWSKPSTVTPF